MTDIDTRTALRRTMLWPGLVSVALWTLAVVITGATFVGVSEAARAATGDTLVPGEFLGMPLFEGFRLDGRFGVHPGWGLLVMLLVPAVIGIALSLIALARLGRRG